MGKSKILKVLEKVPSGTKLYSTAFGNLEFKSIVEAWGNTRIELMEDNRDRRVYLPDGRYRKGGEVTLYPSKEMRDWDKFAWKKGDVLVNRDKNIHLLFEKFTDDTYTIFAGRHCYEKDFRNEYNYERRFDSFMTEYFTLETDDADVQTYIRTIENKLGGKLNRETLEIEKAHPEFKDGENEYQFKPFEKVLVRDQKTDKWTVDLYGFEEKENGYNYQCVGGCFVYCIPYKGNEHLLGTNKNIGE